MQLYGVGIIGTECAGMVNGWNSVLVNSFWLYSRVDSQNPTNGQERGSVLFQRRVLLREESNMITNSFTSGQLRVSPRTRARQNSKNVRDLKAFSVDYRRLSGVVASSG